ncbi:glycosyltransferase family 2 protein [Lacinutrix salivirga]
MQNPLISILIPFKNTQAYLKECLYSIINQTYTNWEICIVDDHSTDNSYVLVESIAKTDNRIKLFKNNGKGIIEALKLAYNNSNGELITRMDSDDIMPNEKLEILSTNLITNGKGYLATGLVHYFSKNGISDGYKKYATWLNNLTKKGTNYSEIYKECVIPSPCWMVFREDFETSGAFNSNTYPEDYDLTFRFYQNKLKVIPCDTVLHHWRDYQTRASRTDDNYAENSFLDLKLYYFLKLDYTKNRPLVLWGAGKKGKLLAQKLIAKQVKFTWICDNPKKIGKSIYEVVLKPYQALETIQNAQTIVSVANPEAQLEITRYLSSLKKQPTTDYYFFC